MFPAAHLERSAGTAGFTIIEVLVALAVIAICLAAIGAVVGGTSRGVKAIEQRVAAAETARAIAAAVPPHAGRAIVPAAGDILGSRWRISVGPWDGAAGPANSPWIPVIVSIDVRTPGGGGLALQTIRLQHRPGG